MATVVRHSGQGADAITCGFSISGYAASDHRCRGASPMCGSNPRRGILLRPWLAVRTRERSVRTFTREIPAPVRRAESLSRRYATWSSLSSGISARILR